MALSLFIDALPYNEIDSHYSRWLPNMQYALLVPNVGYSSSLHWQLYCDKYADQRESFVDWVKTPEPDRSVRFLSTVLTPLDALPQAAYFVRKGLDRLIYRRNAFANLPFKFRKDFSEKGKYLFWDASTYRKEKIFDGYTVVSQDEGHLSFEETYTMLLEAIERGDGNIQGVFGFADAEGHKVRRGEVYSERLKPYLEKIKAGIERYLELNPREEVLIVSDHGMSTVKHSIDLGLEKAFGKQSDKTYIAYSDSALMCIWVDDEELRKGLRAFLAADSRGHVLSEEERLYYGIANKKYGDIIFNLREGYVFANNWFGRAWRKPSDDGWGMHGFWPEQSAEDQMATIILISEKRDLQAGNYTYRDAHKLICEVMGDR